MSRAFTSNVHLMDIKRPSDVTSKVRWLFDVIVSAYIADIKRRRAAFDMFLFDVSDEQLPFPI